MLSEAEDTLTRTALRLRKVSEQGSKEAREIVEQLNRYILQEMEISLEHILCTINALFLCETLYSNEKYIVLDVFYDLVQDLQQKQEHIDLQEIPASLGKMKFLKNEKNVERAVVVYLKVMMLILEVAGTPEHRMTIFKVFCTLFMSKSFITSTKCGYLIPRLFRQFLARYPVFIESLLDNSDKLIICPALLEVALVSSQKMTKTLSGLILFDFIKRHTNQLVLMMHGKGFYEPFYFQMYMERETAPLTEIFSMFCKSFFLEYLFLDVCTRITSKNTLQIVLDKLWEEGAIHFIRMLKEPDTTTECMYCKTSNRLGEIERVQRQLELDLEEFNKTGNAEDLVATMQKQGYENPAQAVCMFLRAHSETNLHMLGKCLGKENAEDFLEAFCSSFDFTEHDLLTALRIFLLSFTLPGEGQKINRIISAFSKKYSEDRKQDSETIISIAMAVIYINTSLHNVNTVKKIPLEEFSRIILKTCKDVDAEYIETLYTQIKQRKLEVPLSNYTSSEVAEFMVQQCDADASLHPIIPPGQRYKYCGNCTRAVYRHLIKEYKVTEVITSAGVPSEIKGYIKACTRIGAKDAVVDTMQMISDPYLLIKMLADSKELISPLWSVFISSIEKIALQRDDAAATPRFFRNIFTFGKEVKKDKKDQFPDLIVSEIMEEIQNITDSELLEMASVLQKKIQENNTKTLHRLAYTMIKNSTNRICIVGPLFEILISTGGISTQEMLMLCQAAPFSNLLQVLVGFQYKPSKHITTSVIALLQHIITVLSSKSLSIVEMNGVKNWMGSLIGSEAFKLRNTEVVVSIWNTVEEISLRLDAAGFDGFEIFIKMKDVLTTKSKEEIIRNTQAYYKNINRILLCLDILSASHDAGLKDAFSQMISSVLVKDMPGCISVLESCEHVLESVPDVQERVESLVLEHTKETDMQNTKYLKKLIMKMNLKITPSKEVVDL
ncbi:hypothetical protein NERG_01452 [Nematocida ausubeli]|uniref:SEC7 domain-containing protein n=1 Tax=Nematocida ausubeli (strain ATCC PRA-371 / ERTm2) TaxID=1913371 RepID=H8ZCK9_NEMA1|nr:hypothetical protein NERG_01452 [Nematocida ausubeli]